MAALSHLWGTVMAVAMLMGALCSRKRDRLIGPALLIVIACGAAVLWSWPASHAPRLSVVDDVQLPNALARIGTSTTQGLLPWPNLSNDPVWNHNVIHDIGRMLSALLGLALIALLWWCTPREASARVFFWTAFVGCLALPSWAAPMKCGTTVLFGSVGSSCNGVGHPGLVQGLESTEFLPPASKCSQVAWIELSSRSAATLSPVAQKRLQVWEEAGFRVHATVATGPAFWQTTEIEDAPQLLPQTLDALDSGS